MLVNGWPGFHGLQIEATESLTVGEWVAGLKERWDGRTDVINARVLVVLVVLWLFWLEAGFGIELHGLSPAHLY